MFKGLIRWSYFAFLYLCHAYVPGYGYAANPWATELSGPVMGLNVALNTQPICIAKTDLPVPLPRTISNKFKCGNVWLK